LLTDEGEVNSVLHFYRRTSINPPTKVSALHKAAFGRLVAHFGGIVEKFGRLYSGVHMADLGKFWQIWRQNQRIEGSYSVDLRASSASSDVGSHLWASDRIYGTRKCWVQLRSGGERREESSVKK
jgi:hypothetical protein